MPMINAANLRDLRDRAGMTLDELARIARVDRGTINRIENGRSTNCRATTIERLATALGTDAIMLAGPPLDDSDDARISGRKSQMNIRMADDARNALHLVALRYDVKPTSILHLAPYLFLWAAETSLKRRKEKLKEAHGRLCELLAFKAPEHLQDMMLQNWRGDDALVAEEQSIAGNDIFGRNIPAEFLTYDYEQEEQNPMASFLASLAEELSDLAKFDSWSAYFDQPIYEVCKKDADALTGGNWRATSAILNGLAALHALPRAVRDAGPEAIAAWAVEESDNAGRELLGDVYDDIKDQLGDWDDE